MIYRQFSYFFLLLWSIRTLSQPIKKLYVRVVDRCPTDLSSWEKASRDLICTPADRYQCTSNQQQTALVEFCYDQPTTFVSGGHCWILLDSNFVDIHNCSGFTDGCPKSAYRSDELYKYQKCMQLDKLKGCFRADRICLKQREVTTVKSSVTDDSTWKIITPVTIGSFLLLLVALFVLRKIGLLTACDCHTRDIEEVERLPLHSPFSKSPATQISSITIPGVEGVASISVLTSDRLWVGDSKGRLMQVDSTRHQRRYICLCRHVLLDYQRDTVKEWYKGSHTVTGDGDLLFIDNDDKVRMLTSDGTDTTLLTTYSIPLCIHASGINGDILVGCVKTVTRYNRTGQELQVIEKDDKGQRLYELPYYIAENENGDVWTSDVSKHRVVVVGKSGRHRFNYTGPQSDYTGHEFHFSPHGICMDIQGHVLVCDLLNESVHLLDQDGQFLSLLLTQQQHGIHLPTALCVDEHHLLYLGQKDSNTINVYAYLQDTDVK